jgi:WD40 repeat protein
MKTLGLSFGVAFTVWLTAFSSGECAAGPGGAKPQPVVPSVEALPKPLHFGQKGSVVTFVSFSADGKALAYGLWPYPENRRRFRGAAVVWDRTAGKEIQRIEAPAVGGALSPDAKIVALRIENSPVSLWDVATGKKIRECEGPKRSPCPSQLAFLPGTRTLAGSFWDEGLSLWDTATGKKIRQMGGPPGPFNSRV